MARVLAVVLFALSCAGGAGAQEKLAVPTRHFTFRYQFTVKNPEPGKGLRVWIPLAHSDPYQSVRVLSASGDLPLKEFTEAEYGNHLLYASTPRADEAEYRFSVVYDVVRREHERLHDGKPVPGALVRDETGGVRPARFLQPDRLVPTSGLPAELAAHEVAGRTEALAKARAIYDYVFRTMRYDKSGIGWGHGDTLWACDSKRGNCTDFHSLFISMARSQGIPSRFEIGFPLPADEHTAEVTGYHCWTEFYISDIGWIPVDISEAWKHPELKDYFFGAHDDNRMQFTVGRDLRLNPAQDGPPLNYFVYPYVERDGQEYANVSLAFSFADAGPAAQPQAASGH